MTTQSDPELSASAAEPVGRVLDLAALPADSAESRATIGLAWWKAHWSSLFVWVVYFLCLGWVGRFVYLNAVNVPFGDEWDLLWWTTGERPVDWTWLWSQHNEHRILLSKLILLAVYGISGHDFRAGCWVVLAMQAILAAVLIVTARRVRGRSAWTDIVFPLALLNAGHCENLTWSFQVQFGGSAFVSGILLALMVRSPSGPQRWSEILATALFSVALCGFGASGIVYAPFLVVWQLYLAWRNWRIGGTEGQRRGLALLLSAVATSAVVGYYFAGLQRLTIHPPPPSVGSILDIVLKFWSLGIVANARPYWPIVGWIVPPILLIVGLRLLKVLWSDPAERIRSLGLLAFLGAFIALAGGIGWGRAGLGGHMGFSHRYVTLSVASVLLTYWVVLLYSPPRYRYLLQILLCASLLCSFAMNRQAGKEWSILRITFLRSFDRDLQSGMRTALLGDAYGSEKAGTPIYPSPELLSRYVLLLREKRIGHFRKTPRDGDSRVEILDSLPAIPENATWDAATQTATILQTDGGVTIKLPAAEYVQRLSVHLQAGSLPSGSVPCRITALLPSGQSKLLQDHPLTTADTPVVLWIPIEQEIIGLRITLGQAPVQLQIPRIMLLSGLPEKS